MFVICVNVLEMLHFSSPSVYCHRGRLRGGSDTRSRRRRSKTSTAKTAAVGLHVTWPACGGAFDKKMAWTRRSGEDHKPRTAERRRQASRSGRWNCQVSSPERGKSLSWYKLNSSLVEDFKISVTRWCLNNKLQVGCFEAASSSPLTLLTLASEEQWHSAREHRQQHNNNVKGSLAS